MPPEAEGRLFIMEFDRQFVATEDEASAVLVDASTFIRNNVEDPERSGELVIVLAEAVNNVVEHAYPPGQSQDMRLTIEICDECVLIELRDRGRNLPVELLSKSRLPDIAVDPLDLPEGGFGWPIIHAVASDVVHMRHQGENRLRLTIGL